MAATRNRRLPRACLAACAAGLAWRAVAADPGTVVQTAVAARGAAPGLVRAGKGIAAVPWHVGQCLRLPLGLVEMVFSPLPGADFSDGLKNTGQGLVAPFKLCVAVFELPAEVLGGLGDAVTGLVE